MLYTLGRTEVYEEYIKTDANASKGIGGSVWQTREEVEEYLKDSKDYQGYSIYGVEADWGKDTSEWYANNWRTLTKIGKLVKLS